MARPVRLEFAGAFYKEVGDYFKLHYSTVSGIVKNHKLRTPIFFVQHNMKFVDALHYATAIKSGCTFFITNDKNIRSTGELEVILIQDLIND